MIGRESGLSRMSSRKLGLWSVALSIVSVILILTMWLLPGALFMALIGVQVTNISCSVLAAKRGSKLWLLASIWPVLYLITLCLSIFAE